LYKVSHWRWDKTERSLYLPSPNAEAIATFSPLTSYSDAYVVEDALTMDVDYAIGRLAVSIRVTDKITGGSVFRTVRPGETTLQARMAAITQYAALCAIMEDKDEAERSLLAAYRNA
jgi:hypothetical protein